MNTSFNYPTAGELFSPTVIPTGATNSTGKLLIGMGIGIIVGGVAIYMIMKSNQDQILKTMLANHLKNIEQEKSVLAAMTPETSTILNQ